MLLGDANSGLFWLDFFGSDVARVFLDFGFCCLSIGDSCIEFLQTSCGFTVDDTKRQPCLRMQSEAILQLTDLCVHCGPLPVERVQDCLTLVSDHHRVEPEFGVHTVSLVVHGEQAF